MAKNAFRDVGRAYAVCRYESVGAKNFFVYLPLFLQVWEHPLFHLVFRCSDEVFLWHFFYEMAWQENITTYISQVKLAPVQDQPEGMRDLSGIIQHNINLFMWWSFPFLRDALSHLKCIAWDYRGNFYAASNNSRKNPVSRWIAFDNRRGHYRKTRRTATKLNFNLLAILAGWM